MFLGVSNTGLDFPSTNQFRVPQPPLPPSKLTPPTLAAPWRRDGNETHRLPWPFSLGDEDFNIPPITPPTQPDHAPGSYHPLAPHGLPPQHHTPYHLQPTMTRAQHGGPVLSQDGDPFAQDGSPITSTLSVMQQMVNSDSRFTTSQQPIDAALGPRSQSGLGQQGQLTTINQSQLGLATHNSPSPPGSKSATPSPSSSVHEDENDDTLRGVMGAAVGEKRPAAFDTPKKAKTPKKKKRKDPNEPVKPVSAYALFFRDTQANIKAQNPNATFGEVSKIVASMWDGLGEEHKQVYKKRTETAKKEYLKQLAAYRASLVSQGNSTPHTLVTKGNNTPYTLVTKGNNTPHTLVTKGNNTHHTLVTKGNNTPHTLVTKVNNTPHTLVTKGNNTPHTLVTQGNNTLHTLVTQGNILATKGNNITPHTLLTKGNNITPHILVTKGNTLVTKGNNITPPTLVTLGNSTPPLTPSTTQGPSLSPHLHSQLHPQLQALSSRGVAPRPNLPHQGALSVGSIAAASPPPHQVSPPLHSQAHLGGLHSPHHHSHQQQNHSHLQNPHQNHHQNPHHSPHHSHMQQQLAGHPLGMTHPAAITQGYPLSLQSEYQTMGGGMLSSRVMMSSPVDYHQLGRPIPGPPGLDWGSDYHGSG
ncbi:Thymocyte selection-associated high mobility group box protein TOX [Merluccius polli]|uniref:Thymocyte selection-associated high mobility group box protein TOX n=1 Tax=Merluccius polli TaxID=89951 RepID=A0AA47MQP2_MERPO|nr:Thymocyte selection-associated high mobility group box protein TOX [Merluccius polli]